jgi:hypothetical protein
MYAIEFETQAHNGIVEIPQQYSAWKNKAIKVILLDSEVSETSMPVQFNALKLKTKRYRFSREDANER